MNICFFKKVLFICFFPVAAFTASASDATEQNLLVVVDNFYAYEQAPVKKISGTPEIDPSRRVAELVLIGKVSCLLKGDLLAEGVAALAEVYGALLGRTSGEVVPAVCISCSVGFLAEFLMFKQTCKKIFTIAPDKEVSFVYSKDFLTAAVKENFDCSSWKFRYRYLLLAMFIHEEKCFEVFWNLFVEEALKPGFDFEEVKHWLNEFFIKAVEFNNSFVVTSVLGEDWLPEWLTPEAFALAIQKDLSGKSARYLADYALYDKKILTDESRKDLCNLLAKCGLNDVAEKIIASYESAT